MVEDTELEEDPMVENEPKDISRSGEAPAGEPGEGLLAEVRSLVLPCIQCGTCTGSCPNAFAMDYTPRRLWLMVMRGEADEVFDSQTFALCSSCYTCTLRCPRGIRVTEAMAALKRAAVKLRPERFKPSNAFYTSFMESVRRHGRVSEMEFMLFYFLRRKNLFMPFRFAPLGLKLAARGKIKPGVPGRKTSERLEPIFRKVEELEGL